MRPIWWMVAAMLVANLAFAESVPKIGYIDMQRAVSESETGKKAQEQLKSQADKVQSKLKAKKDDLDKLRARLEKNSPGMPQAERADLQDDYQKKSRAFEREVADSQADLQNKEKELTRAIIKDLQAIILQYGQEHNYTVILGADSGAVVYGAKSADVTDAIVQRYNSAHAGKHKEN